MQINVYKNADSKIPIDRTSPFWKLAKNKISPEKRTSDTDFINIITINNTVIFKKRNSNKIVESDKNGNTVIINPLNSNDIKNDMENTNFIINKDSVLIEFKSIDTSFKTFVLNSVKTVISEYLSPIEIDSNNNIIYNNKIIVSPEIDNDYGILAVIFNFDKNRIFLEKKDLKSSLRKEFDGINTQQLSQDIFIDEFVNEIKSRG